MKIFSAIALFALTVSAFAQQTAYEALHTVGRVKGEAYLDNLLSVEGRDGKSQPAEWQLVFEDAEARGGFREMVVRGNEIISQRTPMKAPAGAGSRINLDRLQLDSDGAYTLAEREASRQHVRFTTANYSLQAANDTGGPVWQVQLLDDSGGIVQTLAISADTGAIAGTQQNRPAPSGNYVVEEDHTRSVTVTDQPDADDDSTESKIHEGAVRAKDTIKKAFRHVGGSLQEIFTGRRTIDRNTPDE